MVSYVKTDGGRANEGFKEKNDCTVRALSIISDTSYADAHHFLRKKGRKSCCVFPFSQLTNTTY